MDSIDDDNDDDDFGRLLILEVVATLTIPLLDRSIVGGSIDPLLDILDLNSGSRSG